MFLIFLTVAGIWDGVRKKIPNKVLLFGILCKAVDAVFWGNVSLWRFALFGGAVRFFCLIALTWPLFRLRLFGAGDLKLAAVIVACMGWRIGGAGLILGTIIGGAWALACLVRRRLFARRFFYLICYIRRFLYAGEISPYYSKERDGEEAVIPFGLCLCLGSIAIAYLCKK